MAHSTKASGKRISSLVKEYTAIPTATTSSVTSRITVLMAGARSRRSTALSTLARCKFVGGGSQP